MRKGLVLSAAFAFLGTSAGPAPASPLPVFTTITNPIGIAGATGKLLVTTLCSDTVQAVDPLGAATPFGVVFDTANSCGERYLAVSPGLGGFPAGDVYVTYRRSIYHMSADGTTSTRFSHLPGLTAAGAGITFDTVGTFGFHIIVTSHDGKVFQVDSLGKGSLVTDVALQTEGPVVAPTTFVPYGGDILVASKVPGQVLAVAPDGTVSTVTAWDSAEQVLFIPFPRPCKLGIGALFIALNTQGQIFSFGRSAFTGLGGDVLVTSELSTTIGRLHSDGTTVTTSQFSGPIGTGGDEALEGSSFCHP